jgi:single-strand DNA-binding protein
MNNVVLMGRLTRDPMQRMANTVNGEMEIAKFTLAVDRRRARSAEANGEQTADFISCTAFGKQAEFVNKYLHQGTKVCLSGRIQTGSYTNKEGQTVYTTDVIVENIEFAESKAAAGGNAGFAGNAYADPAAGGAAPADTSGDFMNIPDGVDDEGLPFK